MPNGIAQALGGFSAGLQGQGAQYSAMLDQREMLDREKRMQNEALSQDRLTAMVKDSYGVKTLLEGGKTDAALKLLKNRIDHINKLGGDPADTKAVYDQLVSGDPTQFAAAQKTLTDVVDAGVAGGLWAPPQESLESKKFGYQQQKDAEEMKLKREKFDWKKANPNAGVAGGLSPKDVIMTPNGAYVFDKRTGGFSKGLDEGGNPIIGANYDPTLKRNLSEAGAEGAATGKDIVDYKGKLFDSINSGARTLNKYNFAISQIDNGAQSGPVMKLLPNLKEQTILVDVIRKEIGMEILGSGMLGVNPTDKDVTLAMDSAIPESLSPKALKAELQRRAAVLQDLNSAQEKYYDLIEQGYTKGDILRMARAKREESKPPSQGGTETAAQRLARLTSGK